MKPRWAWPARGLAALLLAQSLAGCGHATKLEWPEGAVLDQADLLSPKAEKLLDARLHQFWNDTGNAVVVVSVNSLEGKTVEQYAFDLFNAWGIGSRQDNRGILLLVAPTERKVRIEVGCGLESILTNSNAASVIENEILPSFRQQDFEAGTLKGADALMQSLANVRKPGLPVSPICKESQKEAA